MNFYINKSNDNKYYDSYNNLIKFYIIKKKLSLYYPLKYYYNSIIPLNIFQTWHSKNLPIKMNNIVKLIKNNNPRFEYFLYDDNDCREFIKNNFDITVLNTFDSLIPGAYKADLWRYCILYIKGGIYLDIKYKPVNNFKFINLTEKEHFVLDNDKNGIYNALLVCLPKNIILLNAINQIVKNVQNKYYGNSSLEPTGPMLLSKFFSNIEKNNLDMYHVYFINFNNRFIYFNNYIIFKQYNEYLSEYNNYKKQEHYGYLWNNKKIYK